MFKAQKSKTKMFHPMNHFTFTPDLSFSDLWSCVGVHSYLKLIFKTRYNPSQTLMISIRLHFDILWYVNHRGRLLNSEYFILLVYLADEILRILLKLDLAWNTLTYNGLILHCGIGSFILGFGYFIYCYLSVWLWFVILSNIIKTSCWSSFFCFLIDQFFYYIIESGKLDSSLLLSVF